MTSTVAFNGFDLTGTSPRNGAFRVLSLDGWHSVMNRRDRAEKAQQSGAWESTGFAASLPITVRGQAVYDNDVDAATERREILSLGGPGRVPLTVVDALGVGTRVVETDSFTVSAVRDRMFMYSLTVTACDPLLYGPATFSSTVLGSVGGGTGRVWPRVWPRDWGVPPGVTPGAVSLLNAGTASYHPRLRVDGGVTSPSFTLLETGDMFTLDFTIDEGSWVDINAGKPREVLLNGQVSLRDRVTITGNALAVPVGGGSLSCTADDFTATHSISVWGYERADQ